MPPTTTAPAGRTCWSATSPTRCSGLYHNEGNGLFVDEAPRSTVGRASLLTLAFGVFFFDYDLDGYPDIFAANGHIEEEIGRVQPKVQYQEPPLLFRNLGKRKFENVSAQMGAAFNRPIVARGAAYADFDHDGDLDVLITTNNGPAYLYPQRRRQPQSLAERAPGRHEVQPRRHRRGGARTERVRQAVEHGAQRVQLLLAERPGADLRPGQSRDRHPLEIEWPSGTRQQLANVAADQFLTIDETRGILPRK